MPKYKVTKVFLVEADSKEAAVAKVTAEPGELGELLEFVSVIEQPGSRTESGWTREPGEAAHREVASRTLTASPHVN